MFHVLNMDACSTYHVLRISSFVFNEINYIIDLVNFMSIHPIPILWRHALHAFYLLQLNIKQIREQWTHPPHFRPVIYSPHVT